MVFNKKHFIEGGLKVVFNKKYILLRVALMWSLTNKQNLNFTEGGLKVVFNKKIILILLKVVLMWSLTKNCNFYLFIEGLPEKGLAL